VTLGAQDKKKVGFLVALGLFAAYMVYSNLLSGPDIPRQPSQAGVSAPSNASEEGLPGQPAAPRPAQSRSRREEFHPVLHSKRPEDRIDPRTIDPTLRLDLFTKVQAVELAGGSRNLFQFTTPPPPKPVELPKGKEPKILPKQLVSVAAPVGPPQPPPPPPITFKFYGFSTIRNNGRKTAYFLDGDEILSASEGDVLKRRYKVLKIGPSSVLVEDTDAKRQQSLPLVEESQS
jgi:hypothetical protein